MKERRPAVSGLITLGYTVGGIIAFWILSIAVVILFLNQSDEVWNGGIWVSLAVTVFAFPLGVLLAISSYFKARTALESETLEAEPNSESSVSQQPTQDSC